MLDRVLGHLQLSSENRILRQQVKSKEGFGAIVGRSPEMEKLYRIISKAAHSSHPVLILGESGTGKELVARSIHYSGPYRDKPFVAVDCGSLVPTLIESELFGYVKGPLPARKNKDGLLAGRRRRAPFSSMKSASCRSICSPSCCAPCRKRKCVRSAAPRPCPSTCACWRPPIATWSRRFPKAHFRQDLYFRLECSQPAHSPATPAQAGYSTAGGPLPGAVGAFTGVQRNISDDALKLMLGLRLAGQHPGTGKLH